MFYAVCLVSGEYQIVDAAEDQRSTYVSDSFEN
jgi:hypothetical protein